jgi:hypothetical protein
MYGAALNDRSGKENVSKLELCERGMVFTYAKHHNWTSCCSVAALRGLWELESDPALKAAYARGLSASAQLAAESLALAEQFDPADQSAFNMDWRTSMLPLWKAQATEQEAQQLAQDQLHAWIKVCPRRPKETEFIREPTAAAWIVTLCPDAAVLKQHAPAIERIIARYDYTRLYYATFFWVESAWWRLKELQ